jgi:hypothetical protein
VTDPSDELRERARIRMEQMPAETALGNADPAGGSTDDPLLVDEMGREEGGEG